jgi:hypothetical protein
VTTLECTPVSSLCSYLLNIIHKSLNASFDLYSVQQRFPTPATLLIYAVVNQTVYWSLGTGRNLLRDSMSLASSMMKL